MNYHRTNPADEGDAKAGELVAAAQALPATRDPYNSAVGAYAGAGAEAPSDFQLDLLEYLRILLKHRWLILSIVAASLVLGAVMTLMKTPLYTSTVRLQIDRNVAKIVEGGNITPVEGEDSEFMRTQYELLQGRTMAERVASALKLGQDQTFFQPREFSIFGFLEGLFSSPAAPANQGSKKVNYEGAAVGTVLANRAIHPVIGSRLVDISYSDPDPSRAQRIAAAYADAFVASNLDKRFEANSYAKVFLEDQLAQLKLRLEQSEKALLDFGQRQEIVQTNDKASIAETNLASANAALSILISERIKNEQLWRQLEAANAINLPQLLSNGVIEGLRTKRSALETEYQEKLETFKPSYPAMVQLSNQIAEIDRQLAAEVKTLKSSFKAAYRIFLGSRSRNEEADRELEAASSRPAEAQYPVQYSQTGSRHQPIALQRPAAALQGSRYRWRRRRQQCFYRRQGYITRRSIFTEYAQRASHVAGAGAGSRSRLGFCAGKTRRHVAVAGRGRASVGIRNAWHHSQAWLGHEPRSGTGGSALAYVGSLSLAVHGAAAVNRKRPAENDADNQCGAGGREIHDLPDAGAAFCEYRSQGSPCRCGFA